MPVMLSTVLVVDDDEGLSQVLALTLRVAGFNVRTASDGVDGYDSYLNCPTDWVVTDIQMPKLDGVGMARCIRGINPRVKILYMTGAVDQCRDILERERSEFGVQVLRKPFARLDLINLLTGTRDRVSQVRSSPQNNE